MIAIIEQLYKERDDALLKQKEDRVKFRTAVQENLIKLFGSELNANRIMDEVDKKLQSIDYETREAKEKRVHNEFIQTHQLWHRSTDDYNRTNEQRLKVGHLMYFRKTNNFDIIFYNEVYNYSNERSFDSLKLRFDGDGNLVKVMYEPGGGFASYEYKDKDPHILRLIEIVTEDLEGFLKNVMII